MHIGHPSISLQSRSARGHLVCTRWDCVSGPEIIDSCTHPSSSSDVSADINTDTVADISKHRKDSALSRPRGVTRLFTCLLIYSGMSECAVVDIGLLLACLVALWEPSPRIERSASFHPLLAFWRARAVFQLCEASAFFLVAVDQE